MAKLFLLLILLFIIPGYLSGHPHVFIENSVEVQSDSEKITVFTLTWKFDEIFSSSIIMDCDKNKDNQFNKKEIKTVQKDYFSNVKSYGYFCEVFINGKEIVVEEVENFNAVIKDNRVIYSFDVNVDQPINKLEDLELTVYDKTYFISVAEIKEEDLVLKGESSDILETDIERKEIDNFYFGQTMPSQISIRKKNE